MKRTITVFIAAAAPLAIALLAAGCGGSTSGTSYSSAPYGSAVAASAPTRIAAARLGVASTPLGRVVVDSKGRSLYLFGANGSQQVTYAGHPLYRFVQDRKAGQTKGEASHAFGGWDVLSPTGRKIESDD